jgi:chromate transporter
LQINYEITGYTLKEYLELFFIFLKMGCFTFGGGYAMIPIVERELIIKKNWTTIDEVMEYYTIAQITPGIIAVNLATFIGYKKKGYAGGALSTIGFVLPGVTLIILAALLLKNFEELSVVQNAFTGIRIAVGALIIDTVIKMIKGNFKDWKAVSFFITAFILSFIFKVSPMLIVLGAGLIGLFINYPNKTKERKD